MEDGSPNSVTALKFSWNACARLGSQRLQGSLCKARFKTKQPYDRAKHLNAPHKIFYNSEREKDKKKKKRCLIFQSARAKKGERGNKHAKF